MKKFTAIVLMVFTAIVLAGQSCPMPDHSDCPPDCPGGGVAIKVAVDNCMKEAKGTRSLKSCQEEAKSLVKAPG